MWRSAPGGGPGGGLTGVGSLSFSRAVLTAVDALTSSWPVMAATAAAAPTTIVQPRKLRRAADCASPCSAAAPDGPHFCSLPISALKIM